MACNSGESTDLKHNRFLSGTVRYASEINNDLAFFPHSLDGNNMIKVLEMAYSYFRENTTEQNSTEKIRDRGTYHTA